VCSSTRRSLGLGAVAEPAISGVLTRALGAIGAPHQLLHPLSFAIALGVVAFFHMVVGEMVPKNLALAGPVRAALLLGPAHCGLGAPDAPPSCRHRRRR